MKLPQTAMNCIAPPLQHGLKALERSCFKKTVEHAALRIPAKDSTRYLNELRPILLNAPRLKNIDNDAERAGTKLLLLDPKITQDLKNVPEDFRAIIDRDGLDVVKHELNLDYSYWTADEILKAVLPNNEGTPTGYEAVGHIAHINLREEFLEYKKLIGEVILDKNPRVKTVVNKTDNIDTQFRFFQMEVLAGEDNMIAEVRESGCKFTFDFSKVYWNSKLHTEHERLVAMFRRGEYVCDVFAGVGPFALPAAKKGCIVYANDLNPVSYKYMQKNIQANKVTDRVHAYNLDGREFIRKAIADLHEKVVTKTTPVGEKQITDLTAKATDAKDTSPGNSTKGRTEVSLGKRKRNEKIAVPDDLEQNGGYRTFAHFVMNLPGTAIEFLDAFRGAYKDVRDFFTMSTEPNLGTAVPLLPMIHCHCFTKIKDSPEEMKMDVIDRVNEILQTKLDPSSCDVYNVRSVAPGKDMMCISFRLTPDVAFAEVGNQESSP